MKTYKKDEELLSQLQLKYVHHYILIFEFQRHLPSNLKYKQIRVANEALVIIVCRAMSQLCLSTYSSLLVASPYLNNEGSRKSCDIAGTM